MAGLYVTDSPIENSDQREPLPYLEQNLFLNHSSPRANLCSCFETFRFVLFGVLFDHIYKLSYKCVFYQIAAGLSTVLTNFLLRTAKTADPVQLAIFICHSDHMKK